MGLMIFTTRTDGIETNAVFPMKAMDEFHTQTRYIGGIDESEEVRNPDFIPDTGLDLSEGNIMQILRLMEACPTERMFDIGEFADLIVTTLTKDWEVLENRIGRKIPRDERFWFSQVLHKIHRICLRGKTYGASHLMMA